jgi:hypothetical protein
MPVTSVILLHLNIDSQVKALGIIDMAGLTCLADCYVDNKQ